MSRAFKNNRSGNSRNYFLYAIGEIILIVAGILIALKINNYNEELKTKAVEDKLLSDLRISLSTELQSVQRNINFNYRVISSIDELGTHFENNNTDTDTTINLYGNALDWYNFTLESTAYENIKRYGISFIENDSLNFALNAIYEVQSPYMKQRLESQNFFFTQTIEPYLIKNFKITTDGPNGSKLYRPLNFSRLKKDQEFANCLSITKANRGNELFWLNWLKETMNLALSHLPA